MRHAPGIGTIPVQEPSAAVLADRSGARLSGLLGAKWGDQIALDLYDRFWALADIMARDHAVAARLPPLHLGLGAPPKLCVRAWLKQNYLRYIVKLVQRHVGDAHCLCRLRVRGVESEGASRHGADDGAARQCHGWREQG